jgi:hypothetical protein
MSELTTADLIKAVTRELRYRRRVYPRLIDAGKLDERTADHVSGVRVSARADPVAGSAAHPQLGELPDADQDHSREPPPVYFFCLHHQSG